MGPKQRRVLDVFASWLHFQDEMNNLGNGLLLFLAIAAAYAVLYLSNARGDTWQGGVAIAFTIAMVLGCDLYFFVVVARSRAGWIASGNKLPAILWSLLGAYLAFVNFESLYAYQLVAVDGLTETQAFMHILWGVSQDNFFFQRAVLLVLLMLVAAITRHQRAMELQAANQVDGSTTQPPQPAGPVSPAPGPSGRDRRSGVPAREQIDRKHRREVAAFAYLDSHPKASQNAVLAHLARQGLKCSESTVNALIQKYRALEAQSIQLVAPEEVA